jgi:hypothetical protein
MDDGKYRSDKLRQQNRPYVRWDVRWAPPWDKACGFLKLPVHNWFEGLIIE